MSMEPPKFQEASQCQVCNCIFNTFRRRHHCRCCGRSFCAEHSSNQMALSQFGIHSCVRVCSDCFTDAPRLMKDDALASLDGDNIVTDVVSRLDISAVADPNPKQITEKIPILSTVECKCGMPLCICEAPAPSGHAVMVQDISMSTSTTRTNPKLKKTDAIPKNRGSTSNNKQLYVHIVGSLEVSKFKSVK